MATRDLALDSRLERIEHRHDVRHAGPIDSFGRERLGILV
jgi:hypothetical protein